MSFLKKTAVSITAMGLAVGVAAFLAQEIEHSYNSIPASKLLSSKQSQSSKTQSASPSSKDSSMSNPTTTKHSASALTKKTITPISASLIVTVDGANVREAPGTTSPKVDSLSEGTLVKATFESNVNHIEWYEIQNNNSRNEWISSEVVNVVDPSKPVILDTPVINQLPELQRGCEVTSLAMLLTQAGVKVDKMTLAKQIKTLPFQDGPYRSNPNDGFVGDIYTFSNPGLGVYHGPIADLARRYLGDKVEDLTGSNWDSIEKKLEEGHAVWIIINSTFNPLPDNDPYYYTWNTKEGTIRVTYREHSVLVTGFSSDKVYINDPLSGEKNEALDKKSFVEAWEQMGSQAISYN